MYLTLLFLPTLALEDDDGKIFRKIIFLVLSQFEAVYIANQVHKKVKVTTEDQGEEIKKAQE